MRHFPENYPSQPEHLWNIFYDFTQTPRPSKQEAQIIEYLKNVAIQNKLDYVIDNAGNIIIYVPGKNGREKDEPLIIQNHVDMVTDVVAGKKFNFSTDPLRIFVEGEWVKAKETTLGADNGIGCAAALATIFDESLVHPPLELLFTVDEETGLNGALGLDHKHLKSKKMLNLDTEEWGSVYIGCAGGIDYELNKEYSLEQTESQNMAVKILVKGFLGGHSGVDIHEQRGNAIKFLAEILDEAMDGVNFQIAEVRGGKAHNIIPREAFATISLPEDQFSILNERVQSIAKRWKSFLPHNDQNFVAEIEKCDSNLKCLSKEDTIDLVSYMIQFPHGAHAYDVEDNSLVSTSNNFARFLFVNGKCYTQASLRFFDRNEIVSIEKKIKSLGRIFDMQVENHSEYPSWKPVRENPVLDKVKEVYHAMYGKNPIVTAIHAGLECGILRDKIGPIDVVSFGPTIMGAHSPDERVNIPSVTEFWSFFKNVLKEI